MTKSMLIDAAHQEEVRVALIDNGRLEEFDFEVEAKKPIKGNIYLGKITRVEPGLQAAFVEYGGNRQGFLPFSEIHYNYYQIPVADREKLEEELARLDEEKRARAEAELAADEAEDDAEAEDTLDGEEEGAESDSDSAAMARKTGAKTTVKNAEDEDAPKKTTRSRKKKTDDADEKEAAPKKTTRSRKKKSDEAEDDAEDTPKKAIRRTTKKPATKKTKTTDSAEDEDAPKKKTTRGRKKKTDDVAEDTAPESADTDADNTDDAAAPIRGRQDLYRHYKIQEVIKRNQVVLVQVIKEERGQKGASLTTYVSLAGRYSVYMPNTEDAGGVSRRINDIRERKRLRKIVHNLEVPTGASVILRTAGIEQEEDDINRDYDYLNGRWDEIKNNAVQAEAPALIHEEGNLITRSLRDVYSDDVDEILVAGEAAHTTTTHYLEKMAPEAVDKVREYGESTPLFTEFGIDEQLEELHHNTAPLPSGGSIVLAQTEALVAIDVNSGKATRERSIEDTALSTNLEAAKEVARQLRLRDLAGLVVVDFIDMRDLRNRRAVEKELKRALKSDRAKIQVGRISQFGLLEMSRQRMRSSIVETSTKVCPHCQGTGFVRAEESLALSVLRAIESEAADERNFEVTIHVSGNIAMFLLNEKREDLSEIEEKYGVKVIIVADSSLLDTEFQVQRRNRRGNRGRSSERNDNRRGGRGGRGRSRGGRGRNKPANNEEDVSDTASDDSAADADDTSKKKPTRDRKKKADDDIPAEAETETPELDDANDDEVDDNNRLKGLWKRITQ